MKYAKRGAGPEARFRAEGGEVPASRPLRVVLCAAALLIALASAAGGAAGADHIVAVYNAYWAGLPAGEIRLELSREPGSYSDRIEISTVGLPRLVTHFRGTARADGRLAPNRPADPSRYDAVYDLRKRHDSRISMRFVDRGGVMLAERGPRDTSHKPPLAERFRRDAVDPMTAVERLREAIAAGGVSRRFSIPVYDGARRFDVVGRVLSKTDRQGAGLRVVLSLRPIAGFKGESSDDGDPDDAPRPVAVTLTNDALLLPLSLTVKVFFLPLVVELDHLCVGSATCHDQQPHRVRAIAPAVSAQRQ